MSYDGTYPPSGVNQDVKRQPGRTVVDQAQIDLAYYEEQVGLLSKNLEQIDLQRQEVTHLLSVSKQMVKSMRQVLGWDQDSPVTVEGRY